jgi:hypothetical protein
MCRWYIHIFSYIGPLYKFLLRAPEMSGPALSAWRQNTRFIGGALKNSIVWRLVVVGGVVKRLGGLAAEGSTSAVRCPVLCVREGMSACSTLAGTRLRSKQIDALCVKHRSCEQGSFFFFAKTCKHAAELAERLCSASQCYYCFVCWPNGWPISLCKPNTGAGS